MADWPGVGSLECESVGYLYAEDDRSKTVVPHFAFPDDDVNRQGGGIMVIPTGAVLSIERLVSGESSDKGSLVSSRRLGGAGQSGGVRFGRGAQ